MKGASWVALVVNNPLANTGDVRDSGSIPGSGWSPGGKHGGPLQYSCLENAIERGAWQTTVHRVAQSQTWLKGLSIHAWAVSYKGHQNEEAIFINWLGSQLQMSFYVPWRDLSKSNTNIEPAELRTQIDDQIETGTSQPCLIPVSPAWSQHYLDL